MSGEFVVDASVAAKWFLNEPDSDRALELLRDATLMAPALISIEVAASITRRHRTSGLDAERARRMLEDARSTFGPGAVELVGNELLLERAGELALELRHPFQDCLYLACSAHFALPLLTADETLLKRAAAFPLLQRF